MKNRIKFKFMAIIPVLSLFFVLNASSAIVLKSGSWQNGGQGSSFGNISINPFGVGTGLGWTKASNGNIKVSGGFTSAIVPFLFVPTSIYAYPVPFKPSLGHSRIRFDCLSDYAKIKIYDLSGECVKTIVKSDSSAYIEWNVKDDNGRNLSSGVYFYTVITGVENKTGKLMIIR